MKMTGVGAGFKGNLTFGSQPHTRLQTALC